MDKFLLMLLLLGFSPLVIFQGMDEVLDVCSNFKRGHCLVGKGNCTVDYGTGCRTRNYFIFTERAGWVYNHTELDCFERCLSQHMYYGDLKISTYCCKDQDLCNRYQGKLPKPY
uniref:Prostate and testis expressed 2 n=1 Tax=Oryctolagus cuniculus TaxID=9986 RepID=A0A5F9CUQ0_RABIT